VRVVGTGLDVDAPTALVAVPGTTSLLVAERAGRIVEAVPEGATGLRVAGTVLDLRDRVGSTSGERGLLGLAVAPDGEHVYVSYTGAASGESLLDEYPLGGDAGALDAPPDGRRNLLEVEQPFPNHNGGHVVVGPDDMLYLGLGDGGSGGDPGGRAQDPTTLLGKLVRLDPDGETVVPSDNPFVGDDPLGARDEIYATGLRNPWRFSFDPTTGDLWVADVGQNRFEEINHVPAAEGQRSGAGAGANFGWDLFEGSEPFDDADPAGAASEGRFVEPLLTYGRDRGCSITGGPVYRGSGIAGLDGAYLFSDFCAPGVRALLRDEADSLVERSLTDGPGGVVGFGEDAGGEVYVLSLDEGVSRLVGA
jgi:glucose/arabinose dehydrogenase